MSVYLYATSIAVSFVSVFLKGFQHKNVIGNHQRAVFVTSYLMGMFDFAAVTLIVKGGWPIALTSGTGAAFGMVAAIRFHDRLFKVQRVATDTISADSVATGVAPDEHEQEEQP